MNGVKLGEPCEMAIPSQAEKSEGVEAKRHPSRTDEDMVQTTNRKGNESYSGKIHVRFVVQFHAGVQLNAPVTQLDRVALF